MKRVLFALLILLGAASSQCAVPVDNYLVNSSTIFCEGTYNINDTGPPGIIIANAHGVDISCNGTILVGSGSGAAVNLSNRNSTTIRDCTFTNYSVGIDVQGASGNTITNNSVDHATFPVRIRPISNNSYYNIIENNTFGFSNTSVYLFGVYATNRIGNSTIAYNVIQNCSSYGIHLDQKSQFMGYNRIIGNNIANCTNSLRMWVSDNGNGQLQFTTVENNTFSNGTYGIFLDAQDNRHALNFNNFTNNTLSGFSSGYAVFFNSNLTYNNNFGSDNTFDGFPFYHFAYRSGFSMGNLDLNSSNDATNLGLFTIVNSSDFTLSDSNITGDGEYGVFLWSNNRTLVSGSNISGNGQAVGEANVYVFGENDSNITNNLIGNSYHGIALSLSWKNGVYNNNISNGTNSGVVIYASSNNTIAGNSITNSSFGVRMLPAVYTSVYNVIENNTIGGSGTCIYFNQSYFVNRIGDNRIAYNNIQNCSTYGINFEANSGNDLSFNRIIGNSISNSSRSIRMWAGNNGNGQLRFNTVENNTFSNGTYGVFLDVDDSRHALNFNNFTNNTFFDFSSGYAVFFNDNLTYNNDFGGNNTYDGFPFYHFAYRSGFSIGNLDLNASNDATNLGMFGIVNSSDFTLSDSNITGDGEYGVFLWSNNRTLVSGSNISGNGPNINEANVFAFGENDSNITNNAIGSGYHGIVLSLSWKNGVYNNTISNGTNSGVVIHASSNNTIAGNSITNSSFGVRVLPAVYTSVYNIIENNTIGGVSTSIYLNQSYFVNRIGDNRIAYNNIQNCSTYGVNFEANSLGSPMSFNRIIGNNISNCSVSVRFWSGNNGLASLQFNTVENNTFGNGTYGVFLDVQDSRHVLNFNNFTNNTFFDFSSGYAVFFNDNLTYNNDFGGNNTYDGFPFYHFAYRSGGALSGLNLNASNDATNLGMFSIVNSSDFSLSGSNISGDGEYGVFLWFNNRTSILDSDVSGNGPGVNEANIFTVGENGSNITGNRIGGGYHGIALTLSRNIGVYNNSIGNNSNSGIHIAGSNSTTIAGNGIVNSMYGVRVFPADGFLTSPSYYNVIENNTISVNSTGIHFAGTYFGNRISNSTAAYNNIGNCTGNGVHLEQRSGNTMNYIRVTGNNITNCSTGVRMWAGDNGFAFSQFHSIENNLIRNAQYGLYLHLDDDNWRHRINFTNFTGNRINASIYPIFMADAFVSNNSFANNTLINDNASNFIFSSSGANNTFSNTTFARGMGSVNFPQEGILINRSVNVTSVIIGSDIASINSSNLTAYANLSANVTTYSPSCPPSIFTKSGFPLSSADIIANGSLCSSPQCEVVSCTANLTMFSVSSFSGYSANFSESANISILKLDQTGSQPSPGGIVQFNVTVNNTGNTSLNVTVRDVLPSGLSFVSATPANSSAGPVWTFTLGSGSSSIIFLNATADAGAVNQSTPIRNLTNYVNATGVTPSGANVTSEDFENVTVYYANVSVVKLDQTAALPSPGGLVQFNLTLTNTGNVSLNGTIADTLPAGLTFSSASPANASSGPSWAFGPLTPGASSVFYINASVDPGIVNSSSPVATISNCVSVNATPPNGANVSASDCENMTIYYANVSVIKLSQISAQPSPGGVVQFNITVNNTGNVSLDVTVSDSLPPGLSFTSASPANSSAGPLWNFNLSPGSATELYVNATVDAGAVNASIPVRNLTNNVSATGAPPNGNNVTASSSANVTIYYANVSVIKLEQSAGVPSAGGTVRFNLTITNTGNVTLNPVSVSDALPSGLVYAGALPAPDSSAGGLISWNNVGPVSPGSSLVIRLNATMNGSAGCDYNATNSVNVTGVPPNGNNVTAEDDVSLYLACANVSILKLSQTTAQPSPGGIVQFNITVNNTGNVSLNATIHDVLPAGLSFASASPANSSAGPVWNIVIAPGSSSLIYLNSTVSAGVVNASTQSRNLTNYINATGVPPNGDSVFAEDYENVTVYYANVSVVKVDMTPSPASPGGLVQWSINVSNPGLVTLDPVFVTDTLPSGFQYSASSIPPGSISPDNRTINWSNIGPISSGGSVLILLNSTVGAVANGTYSNNVSVTATPPNGDSVSDSDSASVGIFSPAINLIKSANQTNASIGQNVTFTLNVTNTGSSNLTVSLIDVLAGNTTFQGASVPPTSVSGQGINWTNITVLAPGASFIILYNASADASGTYANFANATGQPPNGDAVNDSDSAVFTTLTPPPPSEGGGDDDEPLRISLVSACSGNTVTVTSRSDPVSGASVRIDGSLEGTTDNDGLLTFQGCDDTVEIRASKSGYEIEEDTFQLISCSACEEPEPPENDTNQTEPEPEFDCDADPDCPEPEYCFITPGQGGGRCLPVIPGACGEVRNHSFYQYGYECGSEPGCPACPGGAVCEEHQCLTLNLSAPPAAFVNDTVTIFASNETGPCILCEVRITDPSGRQLTGRTDSQGNFRLPLAVRGTYTVALLYDGIPIKTILINALPREEPAEPEKPPVTAPQEEFPWWLLILLLLAILGIVYWRSRKKAAPEPK